MKKEVDFLFRYEHKVREMESLMLIRTELERRGYTVAFDANYDYKSKNNYTPKVFICPSLYSDANLALDFVKYGMVKKIGNLLWEQLFESEVEDKVDCPFNVRGIGQRAVSFCWGQRTKDRICKGGVPEFNAKIVGQINGDYLRKEFASTLISKSKLGSMYNLDSSRRWNFFISSFSGCELDFAQKELSIAAFGEEATNYQIDLANSSRSEILKWFEVAMMKYSGDIFIYRPHPSEAKKSEILKDLERKYQNFRVITEQSIKHWISASDKIYNWYSTGHIDIVMLGKPCRLLRPIAIRPANDYRIFINSKQINTLEDFMKDYENLDVIDVVDRNLLNEYYYIPDNFVYQNVCDILEEMLKTDHYDIKFTMKERMNHYVRCTKKSVASLLKFAIPVLRYIPSVNSYLKKRQAIMEILINGYERNVASDKEMEEMKSRIMPILYNKERITTI